MANQYITRFLGQDSIYQTLQRDDENFYREPDVEANFALAPFNSATEDSSLRYSAAESSSAGVPSAFGDSATDLPPVDDHSNDNIQGADEPANASGPSYRPFSDFRGDDYSHKTIIPDVEIDHSRAEIEDGDEVPASIMYERPNPSARFRRGGENWHPSPAELSFRFSKNSYFGPPGTSYPRPPLPIALPPPPSSIKPPSGINLESSYMPSYQFGQYESELDLPPPPSRLNDSVGGRDLLNDEHIPRHETRFGLSDPRDRALWKWANVENLDIFLQEVYEYYLGNGIYSIVLSRAINLATLAFVVGFSLYLGSCIDYSLVRSSTKLSEIEIPHCMARLSGLSTFCLWVLSLAWLLRLAYYIYDIRRLRDIRNFYRYLLYITDNELQTIAWKQVARRLMALRDDNPITSNAIRREYLGFQSKQRMGEHDIANRIMRKDNYFIAMMNKDILDLTIPLPFLRNAQWLTRSLELNLSVCIMGFVFNDQGQVRRTFLETTHRKELAEALRQRFILAGVINIIFAPFIIMYLFLLYFFRYFDEYHKNPSTIGSRQYSRLAEWKFREYNELYHIFTRRLNLSYYPASRYVDQFPKEKTTQVFRFVAFVAGSFAAILGIASVIDPDLFLGFEISKDRTVLFYIGVFGTILAVARGLIQEETLAFDPEANLRYVAEFTHYLPPEWNGRLHTDEVKAEFTKYYSLKIVILLQETASIILTPFVLWFSLTNSCERIIDFFRDCSLYVDGIGYVCCFAVFDFSKKAKANK